MVTNHQMSRLKHKKNTQQIEIQKNNFTLYIQDTKEEEQKINKGNIHIMLNIILQNAAYNFNITDEKATIIAFSISYNVSLFFRFDVRIGKLAFLLFISPENNKIIHCLFLILKYITDICSSLSAASTSTEEFVLGSDHVLSIVIPIFPIPYSKKRNSFVISVTKSTLLR